MSRSGYSDDYDSQALNVYRGAVERAILGKRGQAFLAEMLAALEAIPNRRLCAHDLQTPEGEVCAIGSVGTKRGIDMSKLDPEDAEGVAATFGIAPSLAREIVYINDEDGVWLKSETPEQRYERVLKWVRLQIPEDSTPSHSGEPTPAQKETKG